MDMPLPSLHCPGLRGLPSPGPSRYTPSQGAFSVQPLRRQGCFHSTQ